jgi:tetraacyldisaccharide 4'-kinase
MRSSTANNLPSQGPRLSLEERLTSAWQRDSLWLKALLPLAWLFGAIAALRRHYLETKYNSGCFRAPLIVVGNISVGGSGKTPLIVALVSALRQRGYHPGVVSRGYGGVAASYPLAVTADSDVSQSGDEPLLIARLAGCPVVVGADRTAAANYLLDNYPCDLVLSDDGLQHYRLHRDIEIVVVDGQRGLGNGRRLPAGPLREGPDRLLQADFVVVNSAENIAALELPVTSVEVMQIALRQFTQLNSGISQSIEEWMQAYGASPVHAVAAIGNPQRFALTLQQFGLQVDLHGVDDHRPLASDDLNFNDHFPVVITAKDAVKLSAGAALSDKVWVLDIEAEIDSDFVDRLAAQLARLKK